MSYSQKMVHLSQHRLFKDGVTVSRETFAKLYYDFDVIHKKRKGIQEDMKPPEDRAQIMKTCRQSHKFLKLTDEQLLYVTDPSLLKSQVGLSMIEKVE